MIILLTIVLLAFFGAVTREGFWAVATCPESLILVLIPSFRDVVVQEKGDFVICIKLSCKASSSRERDLAVWEKEGVHKVHVSQPANTDIAS